MYKVIKSLVDMQDNKHEYGEGDVYPRRGYSATSARIEELSTVKNSRGIPLIAYKEDEVANDGDVCVKGKVRRTVSKRTK